MNVQGQWWRDAQAYTERIAGCTEAIRRMETFGRGYAGEIQRLADIVDKDTANLDRVMARCGAILATEISVVLGPVDNGGQSC